MKYSSPVTNFQIVCNRVSKEHLVTNYLIVPTERNLKLLNWVYHFFLTHRLLVIILRFYFKVNPRLSLNC